MTTRTLRAAALLLVVPFMGCSNLTVPDLNNSSISEYQSHPSAAGADAIADGLLRGARDCTWFLIRTLGVFGREGYSLNVAQGDLPTYLIGPLSPGDFLVSGTWNQQYADLRAANILLDGLPNVTDLTAPQKEAMTGFVQTMEAFDLSQLAATRDTFGIPIAVDIDPTGALAPIAPKAQVYAHIYHLLDSAEAHLQNGGGVFPFPMPNGFSGFDTPTTFVRFNRALRARVDITLSDYNSALTDLAASFLNTSAPLSLGPVFEFSTNAGDEVNPLFNPTLYAHPRLWTEAQHQAADTSKLDARALAKIDTVPVNTLEGVSSNLAFTLYNASNSPIPVIRNEELILMRAEANFGLGNKTTALSDINLIRTSSGGLAPLPLSFASGADSTMLNEILYEKRYSLVWEGGHTWLDMRHYGLLQTLPKAQPNHHIFQVMPFPIADCQGRSPQPAGCNFVVGY
ncbi:MAG TPA: RagB/SusD family nutrient uptake outer membrane protein [Gemmatimonadaceae bacterium]|nr:RagB/SusD family nutrient uptake outer membrane protein [Gemmatimonadaceae bacterium]